MVSHGRITHPIGAKCKSCEEVQVRFEKEFKISLKKLIEKERKDEREKLIEKMKKIVRASKPTFFIGKQDTDEMELAMDDAIYETKAQIYEDLFEKERL